MASMDVVIQSLAGAADQTEMNSWALSGLHEILNVLPDEALQDYATESSLTNIAPQLANLNLKRVFTVTREESDSGPYITCRPVDLNTFNKGNDTASIYRATAGSPMYNVNKNILSIWPEPTAAQNARVTHFEYPSEIDVSEISEQVGISNLTPNITQLVILFTATKVLHNKMNEKSVSLPDDLSVPVMGTISTSLPSYIAPTAFVMPPSPVGVNVDFSGVGTIESYVAPVFSSSIVESNLTNPTFTAPVMNAPDWDDVNNWITTEEDSEMSGARLQEISQKINEFSARMQESQVKFEKENTILQKDLQISMQNYQGDLQEYGNDIQKETARISASVNNFQAKVTKALQTYQSETGYDLSKYQAEVQAQVQKYQNDLQQNTSTFTNDLQKYTSEIQKVSMDNQNSLAKFGQDLANYGAKIQKHSSDYQWLQAQYMQLKQDYIQGIQQLIGGEMAPPQQGG